MAETEVKVKASPTWSASFPLMSRTVCRICEHLHPGGCFTGRHKPQCECCVYDRDRYGWDGHPYWSGDFE